MSRHFHERPRPGRGGEQRPLPKPSCWVGAFGSSAGLPGQSRPGALHELRGALARRAGSLSSAAMGIVKLAELIKEEAPDAVRPASLQEYSGRVVALDVSVAVYQFRTAMPQIINRHGQNISSLQGLFFRTLHLLENGLRPLFVFDGKPPELKQPVLAKRAAISGSRRGTSESDVPPRRDSETLLALLGVPYVQAPAEAEATCAALVKSGHAWCAATEDMDALPFGAVRLLRHLGVKKSHLEEISLPIVLQKLGMTQEQFVDLCILLGCDYCRKVRGLGPKKALKLLQLHGNIEEVLRNTSRQSHPVPEDWCLEETRRLFLQPEVTDPGQVVLEWKEPDEEGLVKFLAHEKCMKENRVRGRLKRWRDARQKLREAQESVPKAKGGPRKAAKTMKDFFPVQKHPNKVKKTKRDSGSPDPPPEKEATPRPPARKKRKGPALSETAPGI